MRKIIKISVILTSLLTIASTLITFLVQFYNRPVFSHHYLTVHKKPDNHFVSFPTIGISDLYDDIIIQEGEPVITEALIVNFIKKVLINLNVAEGQIGVRVKRIRSNYVLVEFLYESLYGQTYELKLY